MNQLIKALKQAHLSMLITSNCIVTDDPSAQPSETSWRHDNEKECDTLDVLIDALSSGTCHECTACKNCPLKVTQETLKTGFEERRNTYKAFEA